jgi:hypothetical protein
MGARGRVMSPLVLVARRSRVVRFQRVVVGVHGAATRQTDRALASRQLRPRRPSYQSPVIPVHSPRRTKAGSRRAGKTRTTNNSVDSSECTQSSRSSRAATTSSSANKGGRAPTFGISRRARSHQLRHLSHGVHSVLAVQPPAVRPSS